MSTCQHVNMSNINMSNINSCTNQHKQLAVCFDFITTCLCFFFKKKVFLKYDIFPHTEYLFPTRMILFLNGFFIYLLMKHNIDFPRNICFPYGRFCFPHGWFCFPHVRFVSNTEAWFPTRRVLLQMCRYEYV